jgi:EmrB/QacA subfamily drug resistance transporter
VAGRPFPFERKEHIVETTTADPRRWLALVLLCASFFMVVLDTAIVVVAMPSIESELDFAPQDLQWILSAYALTYGGLLLLGGRGADLLGRRRVFMAGLGLFTLASLVCGLSWSPETLIAARAIQGTGAALMTPAALSIVTTTFPEGSERNKALGAWGSMGAIGGAAGWLIGGPLTDGPGWEWIFYLNLPIGIAGLLLSPILLHNTRAAGLARGFDPVGALAATGSLVLLVYAIVSGPDAGWASTRILVTLGASAALMVAFVLVEARVRQPLLPLRLLRSRTLAGANVSLVLFSAVANGVPYVLTLYAQQALGYSAVKFGLTAIVFPLGAVVGAAVGQRLALRLGFRPVATAGFILLGAAGLILSQVSVNGTYFGDIFWGLLVLGPAVGLTFVTTSIAALAGVGERDAGIASGLSNTTFQLGGAIGVAVLTTVAITRTDHVLPSGASTAAALTEGFRAAFLAGAVIAVLGLIAALTTLGPARPRTEADQAETAAAAN